MDHDALERRVDQLVAELEIRDAAYHRSLGMLAAGLRAIAAIYDVYADLTVPEDGKTSAGTTTAQAVAAEYRALANTIETEFPAAAD